MAYKNLAFASLFSFVNALESIYQDIHAHHYGGTERWWKELQGRIQSWRYFCLWQLSHFTGETNILFLKAPSLTQFTFVIFSWQNFEVHNSTARKSCNIITVYWS